MIHRRHAILALLAVAGGATHHRRALATASSDDAGKLAGWHRADSAPNPLVVRHWFKALNAALAATAADPTVSSRAYGMVGEVVYNAWAAYQPQAAFSLRGLYRRDADQHTIPNQVVAICHAAHGVLVDLFPSQATAFDALLAETVAAWPPVVHAPDAPDLGRRTAAALLALRHADGANQKGDRAPGAYADTSGYQPVNPVDQLVHPHRWQPLRITTLAGQSVVQTFLTPHWGSVRGFALPSGSALRPDLPPIVPSAAETQELLNLSAVLTDADKAVIDFWAANPGSVTPAGMWGDIAATVAAEDGNSLSDDVRMFFALGQALLDAGIACWDAKRAFDSARPITAIRHARRGTVLPCWGGPGRGTVLQPGERWMPYQRAERPTPAFAEFPSGHSTFSAASATVLAGLRGSDRIDLRFNFPAGGVPFDPAVPAQAVPLSYDSLSAAADAAGYSRRLGGIHYEQGDLHGRQIGQQVGALVLAKCQRLFAGG